MNIQVRKNVFETNSSTQHTLTICHDKPDYTDYIGKTIVLGENVPEDLFWNENKKKNAVNKLHMIWVALLDLKIGDFLHYIKQLKDIFNKIGINIEISYDEKNYNEWQWDASYKDIFFELFDNEQRLIDFVFNPDSWYDCYSTEDGCGDEYFDDIKEGNETLSDFGG